MSSAINHKKPEELLIDALRENLSSGTIATIAAWLQSASTNDQNVDIEVSWFAELLAQALGGWDQQGHLAEELGL
jgi:hypothetical protein